LGINLLLLGDYPEPERRYIVKVAVLGAILLGLIIGATQVFAAGVDPGVVCTAVVDRACEGVSDSFPSTVGKVYAHTRILGMDNGGSVTHRWIYKGQVMAEPRLNVSGPNWRTWSSKNIDTFWSGDWKIEVVNNADDSVMDILEFVITE
jgi:hypothetical protein